MRTIFSIILFLLVATPVHALVPKDVEEWNSVQIEWNTYYSGIKKARREKKPIVIVFHTTWCPWCKKYRRQFYNSEVVELSRKFVFIFVDRDKNRRISRKYAPDGEYIPRTMILNSRGRLDRRIHGKGSEHKWNLESESPDELIDFLKRAKRRYYKK